jgi:hypothetical protein
MEETQRLVKQNGGGKTYPSDIARDGMVALTLSVENNEKMILVCP